MIYNNNAQYNTINNDIQWQYTMMYNNNAQYNTMTIHNVVQYESNVCILYIMPKALCYNAVKTGAHCCKYHYNEIFPRRLDPARAPRSIRCRLDAFLPPGSPGSDTCCKLIWRLRPASASRTVCMPLLTAVQTAAPNRLGTGFCRMWLAVQRTLSHDT